VATKTVLFVEGGNGLFQWTVVETALKTVLFVEGGNGLFQWTVVETALKTVGGDCEPDRDMNACKH
jgi:hypothetical protein